MNLIISSISSHHSDIHTLISYSVLFLTLQIVPSCIYPGYLNYISWKLESKLGFTCTWNNSFV